LTWSTETGGTAVSFVSRGFRGRREEDPRLPPGQYKEDGFPVLSAGPTPRIDPAEYRFRIEGLVERPVEWSLDELKALPGSTFTGDIHCVTKWSKLGTNFTGVLVDELLDAASPLLDGGFAMALSYGGYTTNLPLEDLTDGKAWVVWDHEDEPLEPEHGGPVRLLVPHLYFWKSAKWVQGLRLMDSDEPGFWEGLGYHMRGDPWREERYWGD
jgi:DMSO/TMAO reductase YedYZ molybdopterin-dependent catalytic subunit